MLNRITSNINLALGNSKVSDYPFRHFTWENILEKEVYNTLLENLPNDSEYEDLHHADSDYGGKVRRLRYVLGEKSRPILKDLFFALSSSDTKKKVYQLLNIETNEGTPKILLYRDVQGYKISPHTDSRKIATIQIYLPKEEIPDVGTQFLTKTESSRNDEFRFDIAKKMKFAPNSGYGFAVSKNSWHSVDCIENNIVRNSLMLIYYTDAGLKRAFNGEKTT